MRSIISAGELAPLGRKTSAQDARSKALTVPGNNHGRQARLQLLGAADEFVAVHLGHDEVAEKKIERPRDGLLDNFERLLGGECCNDAIASGFEEESPDREHLLVVVYAEDRLLGPQCSLVFLPDAALWGAPADGRHSGASAGLQTHWHGVFKNVPPWSG